MTSYYTNEKKKRRRRNDLGSFKEIETSEPNVGRVDVDIQ